MTLRWKWTIIIAAILGSYFATRFARNYWAQKRYLADLENKLDQIRLANKDLQSEILRLKSDPHFIEQHIRKELGMIHPGEVEYRFVVHHSSGSQR